MKILVLNGSPKKEKSNTLKLTNAFLDGLNPNKNNPVQTITIGDSGIEPCLGCYTCWTKTPGICCIKDDMQDYLQQYMNADLIIWSFPLYYYGMPSKIKGFLDRLLPLSLPEINDRGSHPPRYDLSHQRHVLISTCGFCRTENNYDALLRQFEIIFGSRLTKIICPEGELFRIPQLSARTDEYLSYVKKAGNEFLLKGSFSAETQSKLDELLYPPEIFTELANASWNIAKTDESGSQEADKSYRFMRQMAAVYNPDAYTKDICLEIHFSDLDKTYQLLLGKEKCVLKTDNFTPYTTKIETAFDVWLDISEGRKSGPQAMMDRQYRTLGDFNTMLKMDELFGKKRQDKLTGSGINKKSNMLVLLLPFLALWIFLPVSSHIGAMLAIGAAAFSCLLHFWLKPTPYERTGAFIITIICLYILISGAGEWRISLASFTFGILWLASAFFRIPLSAYYSCNSYGGEDAFKNPLFIKTNRILTVMWGITNILTGTAALFIAGSSIVPFWGIIANIPIALLGIFTAWFAKWYPAKVASAAPS
ncbi:MAG: flavodoxin family protein [Treponema sp.]|nr:flavodoxin family protein [Treponema sp.]